MNFRSMLLLVFPVAASIALVVACSDDDTNANTSPDGGAPRRDGSSTDEDGSVDEADASDGGADAKRPIIDGPGEAGAACVFNRECNAALRCECDENEECACKAGTRGAGLLGASCDSGEQCESALCVEGPGEPGPFYCTVECESPSDCKAPLPQCLPIPFVGVICARNTPDGG